jgi:hypothetical protein
MVIGCFYVQVQKSPNCKTVWQVTARFVINLHSKDLALLHCIKSYFGVGSVIMNERDKSVYYSVSSLKDITNVIIPHFNMSPMVFFVSHLPKGLVPFGLDPQGLV